ncbi:hypothetical protein LuPra_01348 [Luteitalea pratensis]|uniref:Uncharacterized protein n=1 Tax=Luteitalea pratensis TaxID=1855912 RepID=A0A143PJA6_LUTPR|nr:hypothetical protein [Luteitalea pratensis]AMY08158.1 hypothetical protein LuPra_01348 [Luteitalea pratensis]
MTNRTQPATPAGGPLGDAGDGDTGVPEFEQGISNRRGDRAGDTGAAVDAERGEDEVDPENDEEDFDDELEATEEDDADSGS